MSSQFKSFSSALIKWGLRTFSTIYSLPHKEEFLTSFLCHSYVFDCTWGPSDPGFGEYLLYTSYGLVSSGGKSWFRVQICKHLLFPSLHYQTLALELADQNYISENFKMTQLPPNSTPPHTHTPVIQLGELPKFHLHE